MEFFNSAVDTLQTIVVGLGGALCVWGGVNLLEGYGADNPASKSQGNNPMCVRKPSAPSLIWEGAGKEVSPHDR